MGERVRLHARTKWALGKGGWQALNVSTVGGGHGIARGGG